METVKSKSSLTKWVLDPVHSEIVFRVKHMMISYVKGEFKKFNVEVDGEDLFSSPIRVTIEAESILTNNNDRDTHLKSADFFDVQNHKEIVFTARSFSRTTDDVLELAGMLNIRGISNEVILQAEFGGINKDPWGNERAGFSVTGKINRKDWGLNWNAALEAGGVLVADEVKIDAEVQLIKQVP